MHICGDCGRVSEEDSEFCLVCGSEKGSNVDKSLIPPDFGFKTTARGTFIVRRDMKHLRWALVLAFLPGLLNVFGLGHIVLRQYGKAVPLMCFSAFYYCEKYMKYLGLDPQVLFFLSLAVFFVQMWDVFSIIDKHRAR